MKNTKALVTIIIGDETRHFWQTYVRDSWEKYANRYGYDIVIIEGYLDDSPKGHARRIPWQKCLILEDPRVQRYESAVWIDADILINYHRSPCIVEHHQSDLIGVVSWKDIYNTPERVDNLQNRYWSFLPEVLRNGHSKHPPIPELYRWAGLPASDEVDDRTSTGVIVLKPRLHREVMHHIYHHYEENVFTIKEEVPLSYHIFKEKLAKAIDPRFNVFWDREIMEKYPFLFNDETRKDKILISYCVNASWHNSYFLHFIGGGQTRSDIEMVCQGLPSALFLHIKTVNNQLAFTAQRL